MARAADPLELYNAKRDFAKTAEPKGERASKAGNRFIVQKHDARRLHWDLRLEAGGVLKSWAVTRGPSLDPADKRLAVRTEDHPMSYATFEGTIPEKEYGGGTVMLWDQGSWAPVPGKKASDIDKGHLHFTLDGERMKGEWLLVRIKGKPKEKRENWLLRKIEDEHAGGSDELVERGLTSIESGRTMQEIARGSPATSLKGKRGMSFDKAMAEARRATPKPRKAKPQATMPRFRNPQLATLVDHVPAGNGWMHEVKYDGYRCLLSIGRGAARAFTRSGLDWSDKFPGIAAAGAKLAGSALIDGEIVRLDGEGKPSFSALKDAISAGGEGLILFAFDLLAQDGEDLINLPNVQRKERLRALLGDAAGPIRYAEHVIGAGEQLFEAMCGSGYEGVVSKKVDAPYRGRRTQAWLKVKCTRRQEFVIIGWTASSARGRPFASLALATREDGKLRYAGRVGTGFNRERLDDLASRFAKIGRKSAPVEAPAAMRRGVHWVTPRLVAEIAFAEFTSEGVVRHASFIGLRGDKKAEGVALEMPQSAAEVAAKGSSIKISNPDRIIFPDAKLTKGDLAAYYESVAGIMLPWVANRPISLVRCPRGRAKQCFFQKHDAGSFGEHVGHVGIREKDGKTEPYICVDDADGLLACVQMGTIEFHGWGALAADVEKPDRLVFDLDPDEGLDFEDVKKAARDLKTHLADLGLTSFPLLSGGKGLHVVVPLKPEAEWPRVKDFANRFAAALAQAEPERFTATMSKAKRKGRIFIDWLRNQRGATAIMPYSARARTGAPVAAPIAWSELGNIDSPASWSIKRLDDLLERARSRTLSGWGVSDQTLPDY